MWNSLGALTSAIQDGVKEFSDSALTEVKTFESDIQSELGAIAKHTAMADIGKPLLARAGLQSPSTKPRSLEARRQDMAESRAKREARRQLGLNAQAQVLSRANAAASPQPYSKTPDPPKAEEHASLIATTQSPLPAASPLLPSQLSPTSLPRATQQQDEPIKRLSASGSVQGQASTNPDSSTPQRTTQREPISTALLNTPKHPASTAPSSAPAGRAASLPPAETKAERSPKDATPVERTPAAPSRAQVQGTQNDGGSASGADDDQSTPVCAVVAQPTASAQRSNASGSTTASETSSPVRAAAAVSPPQAARTPVSPLRVKTSPDAAPRESPSREGSGAGHTGPTLGSHSPTASPQKQDAVTAAQLPTSASSAAASSARDAALSSASSPSRSAMGGFRGGALGSPASTPVNGGTEATIHAVEGGHESKAAGDNGKLRRDGGQAREPQQEAEGVEALEAERDALLEERARLRAHVEEITAAVEQRVQDLSQQAQQVRDLNAALQQAQQELKVSDEENARLHEENMRLCDELAALEKEAEQSAQVAGEERARAESWRRDLGAAKVTIAELQAELSETREHALGSDEFEEMRQQVVQSISQVRAAVLSKEAAEGRAQAAEEAALQAAEAARQSDLLRQEAEASAQAATAAAEVAKERQAEAEATARELQAEGERRAKVFNNAVSVAVARIQADVEAERDALAAQLAEARQERDAAVQERGEAWQEAEVTRREADAHALSAQDAAEQALAAEGEAARARAKEQLARSKAQQARTACQDAEKRVEALKGELAELNQQLADQAAQAASQQASDATALQALLTELSSCQEDLQVHKSRAEHAAELQAAAESRAAELQAAADNGVLLQRELAESRERIRSLQSELSAARSANPAGFVIAGVKGAAENVLSGMGLDSWRDERLVDKGKKRRGTVGEAEARMEAGTLSKMRNDVIGPIKGRVTLRFWVVAGYLVLLHFCLMLQFTQRRALPCEPDLPGHTFRHVPGVDIRKDHVLP